MKEFDPAMEPEIPENTPVPEDAAEEPEAAEQAEPAELTEFSETAEASTHIEADAPTEEKKPTEEETPVEETTVEEDASYEEESPSQDKASAEENVLTENVASQELESEAEKDWKEVLYDVVVQPEEAKPPKKKRKALRVVLVILAVLLSLGLAGFALFHHMYSKLDTDPEDELRMEESLEAWRSQGDRESVLEDDGDDFVYHEPEEAPEEEEPPIPPEEYLLVSMEEGPDSETLAARAEEVAKEAEERQREADALREQAEALLERTEERRLYEEELDRQEQQRLQDEIRAAIEADGGTPITDANVMNILLLGIDTRNRDAVYSRSDSMILVSVNKNTKEIVLTSFMRDSYVYMRAADTYNRLNTANVIGGPTYTCQVISEIFGVSVKQYALVNFFSFIDVVDAMGGVDIEVREDEISDLNDNLVHQNYVRGFDDEMDFVEHGPTRMMHLNGNQALAYARIRYVGGDRERTERQRKVITLLMDKVRGLKLTELYDLLEVILPLVKTNLTEIDCLTVLLSAPEYLDYSIKSIRMPVDGAWKYSRIDEKSVVEIVDLGWCRSYLRKEIYG